MLNWKVFGKKWSWPNFEVLYQYSPGGTEELSWDSQSPCQDFNPGSPDYEADALTT
jgi:hypothetical protein